LKVSRRDGFQEPVQLSYQGLGEEAFPRRQRQRPAKLTGGKNKTDAAIQISLRNNAPYGPHTFCGLWLGQVEYSEVGDPKGKKERKKKRTTFPSNPVTIQAAPPVTLAAEIKAVIPAGGQLKVPFEVRRLEGVDGKWKRRCKSRGLKGFSAAAVKLKKGEKHRRDFASKRAGWRRSRGLRLSAPHAVDFAGKTFEEKSNLHLAFERRPPSTSRWWGLSLGDLPGARCCPRSSRFGGRGDGESFRGAHGAEETRASRGTVELAEGSRVGK